MNASRQIIRRQTPDLLAEGAAMLLRGCAFPDALRLHMRELQRRDISFREFNRSRHYIEHARRSETYIFFADAEK